MPEGFAERPPQIAAATAPAAALVPTARNPDAAAHSQVAGSARWGEGIEWPEAWRKPGQKPNSPGATPKLPPKPESQ